MSVRLMAMVFAAKLEAIKTERHTVTVPVLKLILLALTDHASDDGAAVYPSQGLVERKTGLSHGTVNNALRALTAKGFILPVGRLGDGRIDYRIGVACLKSACTPGEQPPPEGVHPVNTPCTPGALPPVYPVHTNHQEDNHQSSIRRSSPKLSDQEWEDAMVKAYPNLKVSEEFSKARAWLITNAPSRTFTRRYALNWLNRAMERKTEFGGGKAKPRVGGGTDFSAKAQREGA